MILDRLSKRERQVDLALEFGVGTSTVADIKKNEAKIREFVATMNSLSVSVKERKIMRLADDEKLDEAVYLWFIQKRSLGIPVSGVILSEKATEFHEQLHPDSEKSFKASKGWVWRFCNRHGIRQVSMEGEKLSADVTAPEPFKKELLQYIEQAGLTMEQVYNCDETGLCFRMLPDKTLAGRAEKGASGMKKQKERVTLMACSNATGSHKLPLMFIGKSANPRCFKNVNKSALPVIYYAQKKAWVNTEIFSDWFHHHFVPAVKKHLTDRGLTVKALLLLDNAPAHPEAITLMSNDKSITAMFLPPNTT